MQTALQSNLLEFPLKADGLKVLQAWKVCNLRVRTFVSGEILHPYNAQMPLSAKPSELDLDLRSLNTLLPHLVHPGIMNSVAMCASLKHPTKSAVGRESGNDPLEVLLDVRRNGCWPERLLQATLEERQTHNWHRDHIRTPSREARETAICAAANCIVGFPLKQPTTGTEYNRVPADEALNVPGSPRPIILPPFIPVLTNLRRQPCRARSHPSTVNFSSVLHISPAKCAPEIRKILADPGPVSSKPSDDFGARWRREFS